MSDNPWLDRHLEAIKAQEAARARDQQNRAGVVKPVKLSFDCNLPPELDAASQALWDAGCSKTWGTGRPDAVLRQLYVQINRGTACLSEPEFLEFTKLPCEQMRLIARQLIEGRSYEESAFLAQQQQKDPE